MKKLILAFLIFISIVHQPKALYIDYRDSYVGSYFCQKSCQTLDSAHALVMITDTITIYVTKDELDSVLNISINHSNFKLFLKNGIMNPHHLGDFYKGYFVSPDSIAFVSSLTHTPNICSYKGKKFD